MKTSLQLLQAVIDLLDTREWQRVRDTPRFYVYEPPEGDRNTGLQLVLPRDPTTNDFSRALDNSIAAMASYYQAPFRSIEALLLPSSEVFAIRLQGEGFSGGAAPFPQFERTIDHLKRTIARAAAFVLTDDPLSQKMPSGANRFLDECWFLQTGRGSFITRVALPTAGVFSGLQYALFDKAPAKAEVVSTIRQVSALVGERVLEDDDRLYTDEGFEGVRRSFSVGMLEELGRLFRSSQAESIDLSFARDGEETIIVVPNLSPIRLERLDRFVTFVKERFHASFELNVAGRIFEVRRSRRRGRQSLVGMEALLDGRLEYITFFIERQSEPVMLNRYHSGLPIRVMGTARRLRTQIRIENEFRFEE